MGINDTKSSKLAQQRSSDNKNKSKKAKKQQYMKKYGQEKKMTQTEIKAMNAAKRKTSRDYQKYAERHTNFTAVKKIRFQRQTDDRQTERQTDRQMDRQNDRQTDGQTNRQTDRQTDRQNDR
jgi:hypothetical protein